MTILSIQTDFAGQVGAVPRTVKILSTDSLATVTTAGYIQGPINGITIAPTDIIEMIYAYNTQTGVGTFGEFVPTISNGITTLNAGVSDVVTPTTVNHIATYTNTEGTLSQNASTAINGGNIQAGLSGTAGTLASFPGTASKGSLVIAAVANTGNTVTTISNAAMAQASVISLPDPGVATSNFILSDNAGTQHITTGSLSVDVGNLAAGSSGHAGTVSSFPGTAANGELILAAVNAGGAFNTTISNGTMGQASVITIPDPGAATSHFALTQSTAATNNLTFTKVITATAAALATAGKVNVQVHPSATSQFAIIDMKVFKSTGLSGGGGDRLLALSDGTIVFNGTGITAALLGTPIYTVFGGTGNPLPTGAADVSTAGADIFLQYTGGTTDFTLGDVVIAVTLVQVTA